MKYGIAIFSIMICAAASAQSLLRRNVAPAAPRPATAQNATTTENAGGAVESGGRSIEFNGAPIEMVFKVYGELVDKTILKDPQTPTATITLQPRQGQELSDQDKIEAIEAVLEMNGVHFEPYGEKFLRAVPGKNARKMGIPLIMDSEVELGESEKVISLMFPFKNIALEEAQKALEGIKSDKGVLNVFERTGKILVTDTESNVKRMREIAREIDISTPITENVFVRQIVNASASDIKIALEAIVQESQKELEKQGAQANTSAAARPVQPRTLLGRNNQNQPAPAPAANESFVTALSDADRGMIRGKVLILADERSNKLVIVTSQANMDFFDRVIKELDIETTPDVKVEVIRLKYADAEDVADMINDLIGNAASSKSSSKSNQNQAAKSGGANTKSNLSTGTSTAARPSVNQRSGESKAGELSKDNVTVLADKRINGIIVMARAIDMPVLHSIIDAMDVKLAQVLIETCIIEVTLSDTIKTGIDWVHRFGDSRYNSAVSGGGGETSLGDALAKVVASGVSGSSIPSGAGLNYFILSDKLNLGAVIEASKSDSHTKYLASPVIMTVDNKEATIEATQMRYLLTGFTSSGTSYSTIAVPNYEQKQIGITIKTTPKINPNGTVMLEVEEEYSQIVENGQQITTNTGMSGEDGQGGGLKPVNVDTTITRKMSADISLENHQTVILGGLTETKIVAADAGIPILKDIPIIGRYLFGKTVDNEERKELLVFMTPYVLNDGNEAQAEAIRRKAALSDSSAWDDHGWSESALADPVSAQELLRRKREEWEKQDAEFKAAQEVDEANAERAEELKERAEKLSAERAGEAKKLIDRINAEEAAKAEKRAEAERAAHQESMNLLELL